MDQHRMKYLSLVNYSECVFQLNYLRVYCIKLKLQVRIIAIVKKDFDKTRKRGMINNNVTNLISNLLIDRRFRKFIYIQQKLVLITS